MKSILRQPRAPLFQLRDPGPLAPFRLAPAPLQRTPNPGDPFAFLRGRP